MPDWSACPTPASRRSSAGCPRSHPEIADYPFTTKYPNLGMVRIGDENAFVLADLPGLIEGASAGVGLGHEFLRHVERTRMLVHLVDATCEHAGKAYKTVRDRARGL